VSANAQPASHAVTAADFRAACGLFASGVTVVTRLLPDGGPYGMTVSSFTSVSLDPPLILVCIDRNARFLRDLLPDQAFAVNILSDQQQHIAAGFADRKEDDRFAGVAWSAGWEGVPLLGGVVVTFACSLQQNIPSGDHFILIGEVHQIRRHKGSPLVWCDRGYHFLPAVGRAEEEAEERRS
jgi:flavin reductase (DIM6/NTAB) family NADH-FMN oxidoreductase RutF